MKINKVKKQRQEDLDALLPSGKFENWIVKLVSIKQVNSPQDQNTDGDSAAVFELSCGTQIGSGSFLIDGKLTWGATIKYNSRQYREVSKLSSGQFAIISGTFLKLNDFAPSKKETFYASRPLTSEDLKNDKVVKREKVLDKIGRVRNVKEGPDGYLYLGVEGKGIIKVIPSK